jgi:subtilisin family serine protease
MNKYLTLMIIFALSIGLVTAQGVEFLPVMVIPAEKEVMVPSQAVDAAPPIENRLIVPTTSEIDKLDFRLKGCQILHELSDATAIRCPPGVSIQGARADRIFKIHDLQADVQIKANDVWDLGYDGTGVKVAILDTGVDPTHIELSDSIIDTANFVEGSSDEDLAGHGTHVAGIVTANGVFEIEGNYATGVAPGAGILVGKVCGDDGCWESDIDAGIDWAIEQDADILSMSLGGTNYRGHCDNDPLAVMVNEAVNAGLVVTVSAGNEGRGVSTPACASGAIAVGAVDKTDKRPRWSNYGEALDIVAPGVDILSTYSCFAAGDCTKTWYAWMSGTSMSAPHVAGVAALILQNHPDYTVDEVKAALYNTAVDLGTPGWDKYYGWGRVDALGAVTYDFTLVDNDGDGFDSTIDCNDNDADIYPGAAEVCNGVDDNCDGEVDEDCPSAGCGDGVCAGDGEDCKTCPDDCPGKTTGKPSGRYCCGNGVCETGEPSVCGVNC